MSLRWFGGAALIVLFIAEPSYGQEPEIAAPTPAAPAVVQASQPTPTIALSAPAGTPIMIEVAQALSSRTNKPGDAFQLRLAEPLMVGDQVLIEAGAIGGGEVIDAGSAGIGGKAGKLVVAARYLEVDGQRVPLRGLRMMMAGSDGTNAALATSFVPVVGVVGIFVTGGNIEIPAGARGGAKLASPFARQMESSAIPPETIEAASASSTLEQGRD